MSLKKYMPQKVSGCKVKNFKMFDDICKIVCQSKLICVTYSTYDNLTPACVIWKIILTIYPPIRQLPLTPPTKPKLNANSIICGFGARNCGLLHQLISTQLRSVFIPCWKRRPIAHNKQLLYLWKGLWLNVLSNKKLGGVVKSFIWPVKRLTAAEEKHVEK